MFERSTVSSTCNPTRPMSQFDTATRHSVTYTNHQTASGRRASHTSVLGRAAMLRAAPRAPRAPLATTRQRCVQRLARQVR